MSNLRRILGILCRDSSGPAVAEKMLRTMDDSRADEVCVYVRVLVSARARACTHGRVRKHDAQAYVSMCMCVRHMRVRVGAMVPGD